MNDKTLTIQTQIIIFLSGFTVGVSIMIFIGSLLLASSYF